MSKQPRTKRRRQPVPAAMAEPAPRRTSRLAWLLAVLVCLIVVAIPAFQWYRASLQQERPSITQHDSRPGGDRLQALPQEAVYPPVDDLRTEAEALHEDLLSSYPDSPRALHIAANQSAQMRQYAEAARIWRRVIELGPQFAGPRAGLAMVEMEQGNDRQAVEILEEAVRSGMTTAEVYDLLSRALQKVGDLERAEAICRDGLERFPQESALWLNLGRLQLQQQRLEQAQSSLQRAIDLRPGSVTAHLSMATVAARLGDSEKAKRHQERHQELKEQDPLADVRFQVAYRASLQRIVVGTRLNASKEYLRQGNQVKAEECLLRVLELHPQNVQACQLLADLYRSQQRIADAHLVQQRLVDTAPTVESLVNLASLALPLERYRESESALLAALKLEPRSVLAHRSLVLLYQHTQLFEQARAYAEQLVEISPTREHYELLGQICLQMNDQRGYQTAVQQARSLGSPARDAEARP